MTSDAGETPDGAWLEAFHAGDRALLESHYREHGARVLRAAREVLGPTDAETVLHDVFYRLLTSERMRQGFQGGNFGAWLTKVATFAAIDDLRRRRRVVPVEPEDHEPALDEEVDAKLLVERFRAERLPKELEGVFAVRFLRQLPQREAAKELGIPRSTLASQEERIRVLLRRFLLEAS